MEGDPDLYARFEDTDVPMTRPVRMLDVRQMGPPAPLKETLELLADLDADFVLLQRNDRAPQHLYPRLEDRGYTYETLTAEDEVLTAIWDPDA